MLETTDIGQQPAAPRPRCIRVAVAGRGRERAPLPNSKLERDTVDRFADAIESGDIDGVVALLTDDAWLTMPPEPSRISRSRRDRRVPRPPMKRAARRSPVPTRANTQPAFGANFRSPRPRPPDCTDYSS